MLWVAVVWITASGPAWAFEIDGVLDEPRASMVQFGKVVQFGNDAPEWILEDRETSKCYSPILPADGKAAMQWAELDRVMLYHLKAIIKDKVEEAKRQKLPDGGPPKWWRDLLAAYTTLVSYTPFEEWETHLGAIDSTYKMSDGRVYCFTSGDRGGWVIDREFPDHVIFFAMGTQNKEQMAANAKFLPYYASLHDIVHHYAIPRVGWDNRFCPALEAFDGVTAGNNNRIERYKSTYYVFPRNAFTDTTISLGATRGIRAACLNTPENPAFVRAFGSSLHNPIRQFFDDIKEKHVTFAGHSRGGIGEGLAALVAVHTEGQTIRSLRVVGLATPAASNLWQKSSMLLPNGKEFTRINIQNQSSDVGGVGADQVPRLGASAPNLRFGNVWKTNYGQQKVSYLYNWATNIAHAKDSPEPKDTMIPTEKGDSLYLGMASIGGSQSFAAIAFSHWAGVYAAGIIGQSYWAKDNKDEYYIFLEQLEEYQEKAISEIKFVPFPFPLHSDSRFLPKEYLKPEHREGEGSTTHVYKAFMATSFNDFANKQDLLSDEAVSLWTVFYMSEAALAAAQFNGKATLMNKTLPVSIRYQEGWDDRRLRFVHIRASREFCLGEYSDTANACSKWAPQ